MIQSIIVDHTIDVSKNNPLCGSIYIKLPKELDHTKTVWLILRVLTTINALKGV